MGSETSSDDKITGKILLVENCLEFTLSGEKERIIILHDFKNRAGASNNFQWRGRWSKEDKDKLWTPQLREALNYKEIY